MKASRRARAAIAGARVWIPLMALVALGGCRGEGTPEAEEAEVESLTLPPMSVGTAQELGPHVYRMSRSVLPESGSTAKAREETLEVRWQDLANYQLIRTVDGERSTDEIREGDMLLRRKNAGRWGWRYPQPGPDALLTTVDPFDIALGDFRSQLLVTEADPGADATEGQRRYLLSVRELTPPTDPEALASWERELFFEGHSALPLELQGEVLVDRWGNRLRATMTGRFRDRGATSFEPGATQVVFTEERELMPDGAPIEPPPDAATLLAERRAALAPPPADEPAP